MNESAVPASAEPGAGRENATGDAADTSAETAPADTGQAPAAAVQPGDDQARSDGPGHGDGDEGEKSAQGGRDASDGQGERAARRDKKTRGTGKGEGTRGTARGKGARGRPARLSRERVVDAALEIVTREGGDALSMRRVAEALGSAPMSIYRHVRDKDELLTLLMERVVAGLPRPVPPEPPRARLLALLTWQHDELGAHPWIVDVLAKGDLMAPSILWLLEDVYAAWLDCGLTLPQAADANRIAWNLIIGDLVQRTARATPPTEKPRDGEPSDAKPRSEQPAGAQPGGEGHERERAAGSGSPGPGPDSGDGSRVKRQVSVPAAADPAVYPTLAALGAYWTAPDRRDRFRDDLATLVNALVDAMAGPDGTGA